MLKGSNSTGNIDLKPHWICSLEDELGSLVWVTLRDDTYYVGLFKTFDQYGNIVITDAVKKILLNQQKSFSDIYCGRYKDALKGPLDISDISIGHDFRDS